MAQNMIYGSNNQCVVGILLRHICWGTQEARFQFLFPEEGAGVSKRGSDNPHLLQTRGGGVLFG